MSKSQGNGLGIASLVLGIFGIILMLIPFFALTLSILAVVFGRIQMKKHSNGIATAGFVLGIIGMVFGIMYAIVIIWSLLSASISV